MYGYNHPLPETPSCRPSVNKSRDAQALLPDSVQQLISVIGFPALTRLILTLVA
ncbi:hypothetical protein ACLBOM_38420 [Escherichia coli]